MKKLLISTLAVATSATAFAGPRQDGELGGGYNFAMQGELDHAVGELNQSIGGLAESTRRDLNQVAGRLSEDMEAGIAGVASMAMLPDLENGVALSVGAYNSGSAFSAGYSRKLNEKMRVKTGVSFDSKSNTSFGAGLGYEF